MAGPLVERWSRAAFVLRRPKVDVLEEALAAHLDWLERENPELWTPPAASDGAPATTEAA